MQAITQVGIDGASMDFEKNISFVFNGFLQVIENKGNLNLEFPC